MGFIGTLKQSTAVNVILGPFVDSTDGDTEETALTIAQADVRLSKNAGADAQKNDNTTCAHEGDGFYMCELDATDTNTVGLLTLWVHVSGALAVRHDFQIISAVVFDALFAAGVNTFAGAAGSTTLGTGAINRATFAPDTGLQSLRSATAQAGGATSITLDASASAVDDFYNGTQIVLTGGTGAGQANVIIDYVGSTKVATVLNTWATNPASGTTFSIFPAADTASDIADAVWDEALAGHTTAGTAGKALSDASAAGDPWSTAVPGAYGAGTAGARIGRIPDVAAGAAGGLFIAGTNAATTITTGLTTTFTGNLTGSVNSVTQTGHVKKGSAFAKFSFLMTDSTLHNPATGKSVTATISKDGGAFAALNSGDSVTEIGSGIYEVDLNATDTNANNIILKATATGCDTTFERIITTI